MAVGGFLYVLCKVCNCCRNGACTFANPTWGYVIATIGGIAAAFFGFFWQLGAIKNRSVSFRGKRKNGKTTLDHPKRFSKKNRWLVKIKKMGDCLFCVLFPLFRLVWLQAV